MKNKILCLLVTLMLIPSLCFAWTWTKSWSSSDDGSAFGGADIQNIQNDISTQALTVSGSPAQGAILYYSGSSWTSLAAGTSGQLLKTNGAGANPAWATSGKVIQVVNTQTSTAATGTTAIATDNSIPQNNEGDQYMTLAITPTSASNLLRIDVIWMGTNSNAVTLTVALFQDTTANALAANGVFVASATGVVTMPITYYMTAGTTSATTFKVRAGGTTGATTTFNGTGGAGIYGAVACISSITITEIAA